MRDRLTVRVLQVAAQLKYRAEPLQAIDEFPNAVLTLKYKDRRNRNPKQQRLYEAGFALILPAKKPLKCKHCERPTFY